jgi:SPP1 family predicted phage head-tail adaptor
MGLAAGRLRHRITFQTNKPVQEPTTGDMAPPKWRNFACGVPAEWSPLSVTEFTAAAATQSQIVARVVIRANLKGLTPDMRILFKGVYYDPAGFLTDKDSGEEYITIPVKQSLDQNP